MPHCVTKKKKKNKTNSKKVSRAELEKKKEKPSGARKREEIQMQSYKWELKVQAYLRDISGLVPDHCNKANFFGFPVNIKVMFVLYCIIC